MGTAFRAASLAVLALAAGAGHAFADGTSSPGWSGLYLGVGIGATGASLPVSYSDGTHWDGPGAVGVSASGFLGYDFQTSSNWVLGVELDGTWTNLKNTDFDGTVNAKIDWMTAIDARVGYLVDPSTLLYVKGGVAFIDLDIPPTAYVAPGTGRKNLTGFQFGVGGETAIAPHWSLRAQALYTGAAESYDAFGFGFGFHIKPELVTGEIALAYRLDEASAPAGASSTPSAHSGFYAGAALGAAASATREEYFGGPLTGVAWDGFGDTNVTGSLFAGFDCALAPNWVAGLELSASRLELDNFDSGFPFHWGTVHWSGSLDARLGYLMGGSTLFYGKAGWALINFELPVSSWGSFGTGAGTKTLNGYEVGAGIEMPLASHWTVRVESDYTSAIEGLDFFTAGPTQGHAFKPEIVSGKVGLAYRL